VEPKPSFVPALSSADVFVTTGLDLELWVPALLDKANNPKVTEGGPGYVAAYAGIDLLDVPASYSRSGGDIHVFGNPHIWTGPLNGVQIARNILTGLRRVSPQNTDYFVAREKDFEDRLFRSLYGDDLVKLLGGQRWPTWTSRGSCSTSLPRNSTRARRSSAGWEGGSRRVSPSEAGKWCANHKEWDYFSREFQVPCVDYIEPKPGIPPTPSHVQEVITEMKERHIPLLFAGNYYDRNQVQEVAAPRC